MRYQKFMAILSGILFCLGIGLAQAETTPFTPKQKQAIEHIIHSYLTEHPEILMEMSQNLQTKQANAAITANMQKIFGSDLSPVIGNPKGDIQLVEFFDYQCHFCRGMAATLDAIVKANPNVRVIFKELPIFGQNSVVAAQAALAANQQGKYFAFHDALLKGPLPLKADAVFQIAKKTGLDVDKLKSDMGSKDIKKEILANELLAREMQLPGTPAVIVAKYPNAKPTFKFFPGKVSQDELQGAIDQMKYTDRE